MPKNPFSCLEVIGREWSNLGLTLENILQINDWKIFGSSRQPLYGSGAGGKQARGLQWAESCPSVQKKIDWLAAHSYNSQGSSSVTWMGACVGTPGHLQSQLSWESDPWGLHLGGQSLLWCGPLQTGHGAWGGLDAWGQSCSRYPPFHSNNKSVPFHLGPSGHFSQAVSEQVWQPLLGFQSFAWFFFASYFPPFIIYHDIPTEPAVTVFLKPDLVQTPVVVTYGRYLELTEWEICLLRSFLLLHFQDWYQ